MKYFRFSLQKISLSFFLFFSLCTAAFADIPAGGAIYSYLLGSSEIKKIDAVTLKIINTIPVPENEYLSKLEVDPSGEHIYAVRSTVSNDGTAMHDVVVFNAKTDSFERSFSLPNDRFSPNDRAGRIYGFVFTPNGEKLYIPLPESHNVVVMDGNASQVLSVIKVGATPFSSAISPDGVRLYVPNFSDGSISVIDTATDSVYATIDVKSLGSPEQLKVSPDGKSAYLLVNGVGNYIKKLVIIDASSNSISHVISLDGAFPIYAASFSPDGKKFYLAGASRANWLMGAIYVFDTENTILTKTITSPSMGLINNIALSKDGYRVLVGAGMMNESQFPLLSMDPSNETISVTVPAWKNNAPRPSWMTSYTELVVVNPTSSCSRTN